MPKTFRSVEDLQLYLAAIDVKYATYAQPIWDKGVTTAQELASASVDTLGKCGVKNEVHAECIKGAARRAGRTRIASYLCDQVLRMFASKLCQNTAKFDLSASFDYSSASHNCFWTELLQYVQS